MDLLEFVRGPVLQFSLAVAVIGSLWRLVGIVMIGNKPDHSAPRAVGGLRGALKVIWTRSLGAPAFKKENFHLKFLGYTFHIGMFITILFLAGHVEWFRGWAGFGWPVLPDMVVYVIGYFTVAILLVMLYRRLTHPVLKMLSNFDDYFSWFVTVAPIVTGLAIPLGLGMAEETLLAIHLLSIALLLVWLPFGKLAHAYLIFLSRGTTGAILERRGART